MTVAEYLNLHKQLIDNPDKNHPRPLEYHNRTDHILPGSESEIISLLNDINEYIISHKMKINNDKSKVMLFNTARKCDFKPLLNFTNSEHFSIVE